MYGNPQLSIDRINQQIQDLERLKNNYQTMPTPPQNIINVGNGQNIEFEARFVDEKDKVEEILVQRKTAFISPKNGYLKIKELDGKITEYQLIPPKDEKDLKIEELERRLEEYERLSNEHYGEPAIDNRQNDTRAKTTGRAILKKSE